ncbi:MAG: SEC-C metal-binding domain-containing protein [Eubacteriales bacterium]|nr:SEC-C metal-binding domain-containing protein [Eubacteriales bacterium]
MSLYEQWKDLIENQTEATFNEFWDKYSSAETEIYSSILEENNQVVSGTFQNLVDKYKVDPILFMGFLDGINSSLLKNIPIETFDENGQVDLTIDFEKLYFNMLEAKAEYLYTLEQWDAILTEEKRLEIFKNFKRSKTVIKEKTPGRNDPCPCGSGKKYKKCCGAN